MKTFATSIHCMDGRIQESVLNYFKANYEVDYIDFITEPGPEKIMAENGEKIQSIKDRVDISVYKHKSKIVAVSAHHDCAGNPSTKEEKLQQVDQSAEFIQKTYPDVTVIKLWIDENWKVHDLENL